MSSDSSSNRILRTVLIGLGRIGFGYHAPAIAKHAGFNFVGVADPLPERRLEAASIWNVPAFESVDELLRTTRPDLVVVASPTTLHHEHTCAAFAQGAHVFCDKPVARSVGEFDLMLAAGAKAGRRFLAYQPMRLRVELRMLRDLLARDLIGPVHSIKRAYTSYSRRADWQAFRANGGGLLNNYAAHQLDEIISLLGPVSIRQVFCQTRCVASVGDAEDFVKILLVTESGLLVDLDITQVAAQPITEWQVFGARGAMTWDTAACSWRVKYYLPDEAPVLRPQVGLAAANRQYAHETLPWHELSVEARSEENTDYYELAWRYFACGEAPPVTIDESRQLLTLIERCRVRSSDG